MRLLGTVLTYGLVRPARGGFLESTRRSSRLNLVPVVDRTRP